MQVFEGAFEQIGAPVRPPKSTLISVVPFEINEFKPGLIPGTFQLPACTGDPVCLVIPDAIHYVYIDHERGSMRITNPSYVVARSIVNDYNSAQMAANVGCHPGFFFEVGEWSPAEVKSRLKDKLSYFTQAQYNWFVELVKIADDDWEKTRQHYSISDFQRYAARAIDPENKKNRPWVMVSPDVQEMMELRSKLCPSCGSDIPEIAAVCKYCRCIVDSEKQKTLNYVQE